MKVLITATSLLPAYGGPAFSVSRLAEALAGTGAEVGLWSADGSAAATPLLAPEASVRRLQGSLRDVLTSFRPAVVHDNGLWLPHNHRIAALTSEAGLPRLVSTRGMLEPWALGQKAVKKALAWRLYQKADLQSASGLHATAASEAESLKDLGLTAPIWTIPNGMDLPAAPVGPTRTGTDTRTALFLSRVHPKKGLPMLIQAWARVRPQKWRLRVVGPDEENHLAQVRQLVASAGLGAEVAFEGALHGDAKDAAFRAADIFVLPTHSENFGMVVAEALAYGLPVLTTTAAPWAQLTELGCGWWVAPSIDALSDGLTCAVATDSQTLRSMGEIGRALIAKHFAWDAIARQLVARYSEVCRSAPSTGLGASRIRAGV